MVEVVSDGFLLPQDFLESVQNHDAFSETTRSHIVALAHVCLCCFSAYRFQILFRDSDAKLLIFRMFSSVSFVSLYQTKAQRSGFCLELRSKGAERRMPSPAGRYTRSGLCDEVVGVGCCPQTAFGGEPGHRRLAKCDAGSFVGTSSISFASARARKLIHFAAPPLKIAIALLDCDFGS